jgi:hypothetical protein
MTGYRSPDAILAPTDLDFSPVTGQETTFRKRLVPDQRPPVQISILMLAGDLRSQET